MLKKCIAPTDSLPRVACSIRDLVTVLRQTTCPRSLLACSSLADPSAICTLLHGLTMSSTAPFSLAWISSLANIVCVPILSYNHAQTDFGTAVKIPPRVMFLTQIYGTVLGGFINYAVMTSIVTGNKELLADSNGDSSWSGATIQSFNTNASTWALAAYLYKQGQMYSIVPFGLLIGAGIVAAHRIFAQVCCIPSQAKTPLLMRSSSFPGLASSM